MPASPASVRDLGPHATIHPMSPRVRSAVLLGIVVLMLLAGYVLQKFEDAGSDPPDIPSSEQTPQATSVPTLAAPVTTTASAQSPASPTRAITPATALGRDLANDEAAGGHTIERHVAKSDAELRARLKAEPDISAASTYTDLATAERVVAQVIEKKRPEIRKWENREGSRPNLALRLDLGETIGRSMAQGKTTAKDVEDAVVVLRWNGNSWYVLTSYPEDR